MKPLLLLIAVVGLVAVAQAAQEPTFRARTELVRIDVLASKGRQPITDLTAADFDVRDQGTPQRIDFIRFEELPLNIVVVCDMSLSVAGDDAVNIKRAVRSLLPNLRRGDRVSMITFGDRVTQRSTLTEDVGSLSGALESVAPDGLTA
jgi:Mg-chelatase subunit ChlD